MESISSEDTEQGSSGTSAEASSRDEGALALWRPPTVPINSDFPDTVDGWLPFQVPGFNLFTELPRGLAQWDTGTGKTVLAAGVTVAMQDWADLIIWIVKIGSVENTRRALDTLVGVSALKTDGAKAKRKDGSTKREEQYGRIAVALGKDCPVVVTNYEKLKVDQDYFKALVTGRKVWVVMDEPSEKLRHRDSGTYRAVCEVFYRSKNPQGLPYPSEGRERPSELRMLMLDATPLRDNPEGFFNVVHMLDPSIYGSTTQFNKQHVGSRDPWGRVASWLNLAEMGEKVAPITMQIDRDDPEIAKQFPDVQHERVFCDLVGEQEKLYARLTREYQKMIRGTDPSILKRVDILAAINCFQMLVNNPIMVKFSAHDYEIFRQGALKHIREGKMTDAQLGGWIKNNKMGSETAWKLWDAVGRKDELFTDTDKRGNCTVYKMNELRSRIEQHPGKLVVFSFYANLGIPRMSQWLSDWGIDHVVYTGSMSLKLRQSAEDLFRSDPSIKVFLASDAAGTSLNLEMADQVIHYDLPDEWAQLKQRQDRVNRVTSKFEHVKYTQLVVPGTVEDRKLKLLDMKYRWHEQVMKGKIADDAEWLRSQGDLLYVLLAQPDGVD